MMFDCGIKDKFLLLILAAVGFFVGYYLSPKVVYVKLEELAYKMENKLIMFQNIFNDIAELSKKRNREMENELIKFQNVLNSRTELSKQLNRAVKDLHILRCSIKDSISERGGWCNWYFNQSHRYDVNFSIALSDMFENKTIGSFGDGPGKYKRHILTSGKVKLYDAYDGSPNIESLTNNEVKFLDLTIPHYGMRVYDWVFSIEVAEHIPEKYEAIYLSNIIRHAREGIVLSWATPGQAGLYHVNGKPHAYVIEKLYPCFHVHTENTEVLRRNADFDWLKNNVFVFKRESACILDEHEI